MLDNPAADPAFEEDLEEQMWEPDRMEHEQIERFEFNDEFNFYDDFRNFEVKQSFKKNFITLYYIFPYFHHFRIFAEARVINGF